MAITDGTCWMGVTNMKRIMTNTLFPTRARCLATTAIFFSNLLIPAWGGTMPARNVSYLSLPFSTPHTSWQPALETPLEQWSESLILNFSLNKAREDASFGIVTAAADTPSVDSNVTARTHITCDATAYAMATWVEKEAGFNNRCEQRDIAIGTVIDILSSQLFSESFEHINFNINGDTQSIVLNFTRYF